MVAPMPKSTRALRKEFLEYKKLYSYKGDYFKHQEDIQNIKVIAFGIIFGLALASMIFTAFVTYSR